MVLQDSVIVKVSLEIVVHINNFPILDMGLNTSRQRDGFSWEEPVWRTPRITGFAALV